MNRKNLPVPIDCLDKPRSLLFTFDSASAIKIALKSNPLLWQGFEWPIRLLDPEFLPIILNAMLAHEGTPPSVEFIRSQITMGDQVETLSKAVMRAFAHFQGQTDEEFDEHLTKMQEEAEKINAAASADPPVSPTSVN